MTKKNKTAPKSKKAKQLGMGEGFDRKSIPAIDEKAEELLEVEEEQKGLGKRKQELKAALATLVAEHGLKKYEYLSSDGDEMEVKAESKTNVVVKRKRKAKAKDAE